MKRDTFDTGRAPDEVQYYDWRLVRWNASETRERLDATGRGIYRELLDQCYAQGGFPDDAEWISKRCACSVREYTKIWPLIERHFPERSRKKGYRYNVFADIWRKKYFSLCKANRSNGKTGGIKSSESKKIATGRQANAKRPLDPSPSERSSLSKEVSKEEINTPPNPPQAGGDVRVPDIAPPSATPRPPRAADLDGIPSPRFRELWELWPRKVGIDSAGRDWTSLVTTANDEKVFACARRYLASDEVARGVVQNLGSTERNAGWLVKCARDNWECTWPPARGGPRRTKIPEPTREQQLESCRELIASPDEPEEAKAHWRQMLAELEARP